MLDIKFVEKKSLTIDEKEPWNILVVDDEPEVHNITQLVLNQFTFNDRKLKIYNAYSAKEAYKFLKTNNDIALVLLDVVMETDDAGLILAKQIREELNNKKIRIILRTGQPGFAPEKEIIYNYDINDYKEKTELTSVKLYTSVLTALRAYCDLKELEEKNALLVQQSKFAAMGEMMDAVAHQWKQPLSVIKLAITSLEFKYKINNGTISQPDFNKTTYAVNKQISHLLDTINDFRKMFKEKQHLETVNIKIFLEEVLILMKDSLIKYHINFVFDGDLDIDIKIIPNEFKHIFINLINNAKDQFISNNIENREIIFQWYRQNKHIIINVIDNAGGIDTDNFEKLFEIHFTTKNEENGSGMGLYMSKIFCEKIDAKIDAKNVANGACFQIELKD